MATAFGFDEFVFDPERLELTRGGEALRVDALVLRLLGEFLRRPGELITKQELIARVWEGRVVSENALTVAITRLRKTLGHGPRDRTHLQTIHGRGYRFIRPVVDRTEPRAALAALQPNPSRAGSPFVGRDRVLQQLVDALDDARQGCGSLVVLSGEPGIGKTRAAEVLAKHAAREHLPVAFGYCRESGDTPPLWPFAQLVRGLLARLPIVETLKLEAPELMRLLPELSAGNSSEPERPPSKYRVFEGLARALALAAEKDACVAVLDDLHRADAATLEFASYVIDEIARTRLLLIATLRDREAGDDPHLARVLGHRNCTRIPLPRLDQADVASYVEALLGDTDPQWGRAIFRKSEGNPFFMTELARQARTLATRDLAALEVPDAALDIVRQRVARLDVAARGALSAAAVIGRSFSLSVLQSVSGRSADELMLAIDEAVAQGVLVQARESLTAFEFAHELLRDVLYAGLGKAERRRAHLAVALALEQRPAGGHAVAPADLAYHFRAALPIGDPRKTVEHCIKAADAAGLVHAYADAAACLAHAREALELLDAPSARMRIGLALRQALLTRAYSVEAFVPLIRHVIKLAREQNAADPLARAAMLLDPYPGFEPIPGSREALQAALAALAPDERTLRAALLARLAMSAPLAYDEEASSQQLTAAEALARESPELLDRYSTAQARLFLCGGPGHEALAEAALCKLWAMCRAQPTYLTVPPLILEIHAAIRALQCGECEVMHRVLERAEARSRQLDSELHWHFQRFRALARIDAGERSKGVHDLLALHARASERLIGSATLLCRYDESVVLMQPATQRKQGWEAPLAPQAQDPPGIWSIKVRALAAAGLRDEARAALALVPPAALRALPRDRDYLGTLGSLARAALELRARDYQEVLSDLLAPHCGAFAAHVSFVCEGSVSQLLGLLARSLGREQEARARFETALGECERAGLRRCASEARLQLALD